MSTARYALDRQYHVFLLKAWTKDTLADKISKTLDPYPPDAIVSVEARVDFQFFVPWRRDWALIVEQGNPSGGPSDTLAGQPAFFVALDATALLWEARGVCQGSDWLGRPMSRYWGLDAAHARPREGEGVNMKRIRIVGLCLMATFGLGAMDGRLRRQANQNAPGPNMGGV